jgi:hypothetical protein
MQNLAATLLAASASAIALKDPKFNDFYADVEKDHYVKADELNDFIYDAENQILDHGNV